MTRRPLTRGIFVAYLVFAHAVLGIALAKTDLLQKVAGKLIQFGFYPMAFSALAGSDQESMTMLKGVHRHMDPSVPSGATVFLGDSITMSLATAAVAPFSINYGIGGQRSDQLITTMDLYRSLKRAGTVVITIGTNDLLQAKEEGIGDRYKAILAKVPPNVRVVLSSVPPIREVWRRGRRLKDSYVRNVVSIAKGICESDTRCVFVDTYGALTRDGSPLPDVLQEDGVHLAPVGYGLWIDALRRAMPDARR